MSMYMIGLIGAIFLSFILICLLDKKDPVNPVKPVDPVNPVNPVKPINPVNPVNLNGKWQLSNYHVIMMINGNKTTLTYYTYTGWEVVLSYNGIINFVDSTITYPSSPENNRTFKYNSDGTLSLMRAPFNQIETFIRK